MVFQNYHRHSMYTNPRISDSAVNQEQYAKRAVELGHGILSSMEHGWQGNYYETYNLAKKYGLKPLIGAEAYWVKDRLEKDRSNCHIYIGAMSENGRQALNDVLSEANITGFYGQPRLDIPLILSLPKDDVVVTSACIAGWRYKEADEIMLKFSEHFGKNFFLEVQYHNVESQRELNKRILKLHNEYNIPIIMGCDSHYIYPSDDQTRSDFLVSKGLRYEDEENWMLDYPDGDTAYRRFAEQCVLSHQEIKDAIDNTNIFLEVKDYDSPIFNDELKLPSLHKDWSQEQKNEEYKRLVWNGWDEYKKDVPKEEWKKYEEEINKEINTVIDTNMADYFIIDHEVMRKGKENGGWLTKTGRGSGASFFTNTLLGFSDIDRISASVHLYPERFMSATRILESKGIPDIDMNEAPTEPFVKAQAEVLGKDHSYPMIAYGTMKTSASWKLYAKSQGIPFDVANAISEQIKNYETALKHADEDEKDYIDIEKYISSEYRHIYEKSSDYLGLVTSWSIAPCSSLIYDGNIRKEIGLVKIKDNICCLMDGHWAENGHFLKNDHLKVSVVELIYKVYHRIGKEPPKVKELLKMCPPEDAAWDIFEKGATLGINQCEREGTKARVMKYKPRNISELSAFVAAIRPGGASFYKKFESREPFSYGIATFDKLIQTKEFPYSFLIYQEQVMKALNYAGIDMAECYTAIKNIAKKRAEKVLIYKESFITGFSEAIQRDEGKTESVANALAEELWGVIVDCVGYLFNASHAYCVALDALYGAWLKAHYPLEFYEVYISIQEAKGEKDKINAAREEAESYFGIKFAQYKFGQDNRTIHADKATNSMINSIGSIKGYGVTVGKSLYACGKEKMNSFIDVLSCLDNKGIKEAKYRPLILIDYFSDFGNQRELLNIAKVWEFFKHGEAKSIKKALIVQPEIQKIILQYAISTKKDGSEAAAYTFSKPLNVASCMHACENYILSLNLEDIDIDIKAQNSLEILGYVDVATGKESDRKTLFISDISAMKDKNTGVLWGYRLGTRSLGSGKSARLTIKPILYEMKPIKKGSLIKVLDLWKNSKGYWYIRDYDIISNPT